MSSPERSPGAALAQPTEQQQRIARIAGVLWILTFITSISAYLLYNPVLDDTGFITGTGSESRVLVGAFLELLLIIANIGTAVVPFSIHKRQSEGLALGFVTARVMESTFIAVGILSMLALVTLRQDLAGANTDPATLETVGRSLVAVKDWTFVLGPGFVVGVGNGLIMGSLMYRSGLVPRPMAMLGLIGGPLICATGIAVVLGAIDQGGSVQSIATIPEFLWELSLGIYLTVKGFKASPVLT
ncbi:MAG: hypothetical protein QOC92_2649 [Acidimicrobiaceae bacterium]